MMILTMLALQAVIGLSLAACATPPALSVNQQTALVKDHPHTDVHRTMDYRIEFTYTFKAGKGEANDRLAFTGRVVPRRGLDTFVLRLHFLDAAGQALGTTILYAPGAGRGAGRPAIDRLIDVPAGTEKIGFSHVARERRVLPGRR